MRQVLIVSGVLGGGTTLVFAAAALVATIFPSGTLVPTSPWGGDVRFERAMPAVGGPVWFDDANGGGGVFVRPLPIGPGADIDPGIDVVVPPALANPGEVVN